jgi:hypothetical protein
MPQPSWCLAVNAFHPSTCGPPLSSKVDGNSSCRYPHPLSTTHHDRCRVASKLTMWNAVVWLSGLSHLLSSWIARQDSYMLSSKGTTSGVFHFCQFPKCNSLATLRFCVAFYRLRPPMEVQMDRFSNFFGTPENFLDHAQKKVRALNVFVTCSYSFY